MSAEMHWPKVAVIGAGAVGGYFGGMLARAGAPVTMIGRQPFVAAVKKSGLQLDALNFQETVYPEASTDIAAAAGAEVILFCVKTTDSVSTARSLEPHLSPGAIVVSLQNGVNNAEEIRAAAGIDALPAVVYVAAAMSPPGYVKHLGRGDLVVGPNSERTDRIASILQQAQVPCRISENIEGELWTKLL